MTTRSVQQILPPPPAHMVGDGFRVHNFFPGGYNIDQHRMSPFYLLDYNALIDFSPRDTPRGVGVHPHRGFETVTIAYHGSVAHNDSHGHSGVIKEGGVQWMTAGAGVLHKEYHEAGFSQQGGPFQMVQLWINLPAKDKMTTPNYQSIDHEQAGRFVLPGDNGVVEVIAGNYNGAKGPAHTHTPIEMYNVKLQPGGAATVAIPQAYNTGLLVVEGSVAINGAQTAPADSFVLMQNDGDTIELFAAEGAVILVLAGEPINEPIAAYGPFLMNTHEELEQAYKDLAQGKFGHLED